MGLSERGTTVVNGDQFNRLAEYLRLRGPDLPVPGSRFKAYGTVQ